jgi:glutaredoxin
LNAQVLGISVDSVPCLKAWATDLGGINYPLLSDFWPHGAVAQKYDVLRAEGHSERALFVIDKQGVIRYIDIHNIDEQPDNKVLLAEIRRIDPLAAANEPTPEKPTAKGPLPHGGVVMYCTSWCPGCRRARLWFNERNVKFIEIDINAVPGATEQVMKWANGNRSTPLFDIEGDIIINFDETKVMAALKKHKILG